MTYHLFSGDTHQCEKCEAYFIPFQTNLPCPRCGAPATHFDDFIIEAASGLEIHKSEWGHYSPEAFFVGCLQEHVFLLLCRAFDDVEGASDFEAALAKHLDASDWGDDQAYLRSHVYDIGVVVNKRMRRP